MVLTKWWPFVWISNGWASGFEIPFQILTIYKPASFDHLKTRLVQISDPHCIQTHGISAVTAANQTENIIWHFGSHWKTGQVKVVFVVFGHLEFRRWLYFSCTKSCFGTFLVFGHLEFGWWLYFSCTKSCFFGRFWYLGIQNSEGDCTRTFVTGILELVMATDI